MMRWLSRYQGATTRSRLDRAVVARYFAFLMISQLFLCTLIGVIFSKQCLSLLRGPVVIDATMFTDSVQEIVTQIGRGSSFNEIVQNLDSALFSPL